MKNWVKDTLSIFVYNTVWTLNFIRRIEWRGMLEYIDPEEGERILDVACGEGLLSLRIAERGCEVCGTDMSEEFINLAKRLAKKLGILCEFRVGNAEALPYPDGCFDKVLCSSSLEHFENDVGPLKEMRRVLKPGGSVVLTIDSFTYPISDELKERHRKAYHVVNYYTQDTLRERFEMSGLEMRRSKYLLHSRLTSFFYNFLTITSKLPGILRIILSLIAYPLCLASERYCGKKDKGYTLLAEGKTR